MKKSMVLLFLFLLCFGATSYASQPTSVYDAIEGSKDAKADPAGNQDQTVAPDEPGSIFPFLVKLVISLVFIILLIYLLLKFWASKTRQLGSRGPFTVLGGIPLGTNRSMQAVLIGETIYLLGVGENVQLIRAISTGEEYDQILSSMETQELSVPSFDLKKWLKKEEPQEADWEKVFQAQLDHLNQPDSKGMEQWLHKGQEEKK